MVKKKIQSAFFCQNCGAQSPTWLGKFPQCNEWNTFVESIITKTEVSNAGFKSKGVSKPTLVNDID